MWDLRDTNITVRLQELLKRFSHLFSKDEFDLGFNKCYFFKIETGIAKPIKQRPYRLSENSKLIVENQIKELLKLGIIEPSHSPWESPIILVKNKTNT